jgi:hypothetical protein
MRTCGDGSGDGSRGAGGGSGGAGGGSDLTIGRDWSGMTQGRGMEGGEGQRSRSDVSRHAEARERAGRGQTEGRERADRGGQGGGGGGANKGQTNGRPGSCSAGRKG